VSFDEDDFNPRDSADAVGSNNNGSFGDFSAAFASNNNPQPTFDPVATDDDGDDFADFSSAFGGSNPATLPSAPAPAVAAAAPASAAPMFDLFSDSPASEKVSTIDLLSGLDLTSGFGAPMTSSQTSNFSFSPPPPLIGAHAGMGLPMQPQSGSLFDFDPKPSPAVPQQVSLPSATSMSHAAKKPTTWDTVGGVNIDLDNLKLGGKMQKKPSLPMNALMTPTSSPTKGFSNQGSIL
jgi:hypothetical protein